jgi:5-oxoprolinase (ATP-hydrolysing)
MNPSTNSESWEFFVDTGGTFTDCLGRSPNGDFFRAKVLSRGSLSAKVVKIIGPKKILLSCNNDWPSDFPIGFTLRFSQKKEFSTRVIRWQPLSLELTIENELPDSKEVLGAIELHSGWESPVLGMRLILARQGVEVGKITSNMRLATTRCTNALLEGKGTHPVLITTSGFADLLEIGDQRRLQLFDLVPQKRRGLAGQVFEINERMDAEGNSIMPPVRAEVEQLASELVKKGQRIAVVSLMHSSANDQHEKMTAHIFRLAGMEKVVESAEIHAFPKWLPRTESAVVEAYLSDILDEYLNQVERSLGQGGQLWVMGSSGGLQKRYNYRAIDSLLSGPAAGVVGAGAIAQAVGVNQFINLDMGGTSTDVSRYSDSYDYHSPHQVGEARISSVSLKIETVAAGGGSICKVENGLLRVGPESAGANPGPACYGFGGPLCLTDVNLILGRLSINRFSTPVYPDFSRQRIDELVATTGRKEKDLLHGFLAVANDAMASAIRKVSVEEGYDPTEHALVAFGGAGGQHACGVAERLKMNQIILPADSGLLSAYGLSKARVERIIEKSLICPMDPLVVQKFEDDMIRQGKAELADLGNRVESVEKRAFIRLLGQDFPMEIIYEDPNELELKYRKKFERVFGYFPKHPTFELHSLRILLAGSSHRNVHEEFYDLNNCERAEHKGEIDRSDLCPKDSLDGPLLITDEYSTLWVNSGWKIRKGSKGSLILDRSKDKKQVDAKIPSSARRELFSSRFLYLAEEMGAQLERTALSTNVRERLDFSCALLDENGFLVANAPHIPVHLGAMGIFARSLIDRFPQLSKGDVLVSNHPAFGGSHLPDISVLAPVFGEDNRPVCFLANRAHHAEIGGISAGSMPAGASSLAEEGVVLVPQFLFAAGQSRLEQIETVLRSQPYPSRQVPENLADLSAQVASLRLGMESMEAFLTSYGEVEIRAQMQALREESRLSCRKYLENLGSVGLSGIMQLDDGDALHLEVRVKSGRAVFDFSGTSSERGDNLNATAAIVYSAVCYSLRVLINSNLPLNEGLLDPVEVIIPKGSILQPYFSLEKERCPGVAGGNVEISQRLVDLILSSVFQVVACSQGTMNNVTFGNEKFSHYETLCGGSGAKIGQDGTSAVQVHMTNTAITDPEILEAKFPIRLLAFRKRSGSGGVGTWQGGEGIVREYLFEEEMQISLLTQSRLHPPAGLAGGGTGACGKQVIIRANGIELPLDFSHRCKVFRGDRLLVFTPGGGGAGESELVL